MASGPITVWQIDGETMQTVTDFILRGGASKITADGDCSHEVKRCLLLGRKAMTYLDHILKSFADKGLSCQSYGFSSSLVWMWELDHKESWAPRNWCFWPVMLDKTLERPLDCREIQPVNPKRNQFCIFIGRTNNEAEGPILWPPDMKNSLIRKDHDTEKEWKQEEKAVAENEMIGWHYWLDGQEFEQALGVDDVQGSLACCSPWGLKESDTTEQLNN